ncbi:hypothetical protein DACRYDRAFT_108106 [Dacryopinax primogenitus]|uniref:G-protein coupled receptors family 1 profile domain-containing protein n=1 Tax=Dacryopinax primogenitus (strain DJM 731) TaxID=1858805 RepID=M5FUX2_DACPD|nr:uncharacterized protein DACRYDRAFT_108106 [Dacryopinax primogenitus]EJU01566.1 hypothetical protein DACRYDRAFT_108106 [Dacryopinax primogenitus]
MPVHAHGHGSTLARYHSYYIPPFALPLYFIFLLLGASLLIALIITLALVRPLHRTATLLNLCVAWVAVPLMLSFLLFAGQVNNPQPSFPVCLTSAALALGASPLGGFAASSMVFQIFLLVVHPIRMGDNDRWVTLALVAFPWVAGLAYLIATLGVGLAHPNLVIRSKFYCILASDPITSASSAMIIFAMVLSVLLILTIILKVYRTPLRRPSPPPPSHTASAHTPRIKSNLLDLQLCLRLLIFGGYVLFAIFAGIVAFWNYASLVPDLVLSTVPIAVFCIFASQRDVLRAWGIGRKTDRGERGESMRGSQRQSTGSERKPPSVSNDPLAELDVLEMGAGAPVSPSLSVDAATPDSTLVGTSLGCPLTPVLDDPHPEKHQGMQGEEEVDLADEELEPPCLGEERVRRSSFTRTPEDDRFVLRS